MKTDSNRPPTASGNGNHGRSSSLGQQGDAGQQGRPQRVSSATYFDIANTILGSAGDLDEVLLCAARDGDYNRIEQLLCQRRDIIVDVDCKDKRTGNTALIWAAKKGHTKIAQLLLRHGADPTLRNYEAQTALEVATGAAKTMLLDSVARGTECTHRLLLQAAWQGNIEVIRRLVATNRMLDINCQNAEGLTPLMLVARDVQLFERLSSQLNKHYNPVEVAQELMKARANVHAMDNDGKTCLHYAAQARAGVAEKLVETFIGGGSEPACLDKRQYTPMHWASHFGNTTVVTALLGGGSEVNCRGFAGLTPLHISAHNDHQTTAVTLLQNGADVTLTDDRGLTPVDLAKTRKMKTTLKEAWTEATQKKQTTELAPVRNPSRDGSRLSKRDASPEKKKGEVIFDGMPANPFGSQRISQAARSRALQRAGKQLLQDIETGRYTPTPTMSRESTRLLGTIRNTGPSILPQISRGCPSPTNSGCPSPDSPPPGRRSSIGDEMRRSLEDGRNMAGRTGGPLRGRLNKTTPISTNDAGEGSSGFTPRRHRRTGSDPFSSPSFSDVTATLDSIINRRGRSVSTGDGGSPDDGYSSSQRMTTLRTPLDRETTMCVNIPTTIPEANSPGNSTNTVTFETDARASRHSTMPMQVMPLPPNSSQILPPTPNFLNHRPYATPEGALVKAMREEDSSKEPSPRSDEEGDNKVRIGVTNPMDLLRSRSLLKEEFILAESRPRDPFMHSSGSEPTSSSSSLSTASSSPRDGAVNSNALGRTAYRRSDPSLLTVTLREQAAVSSRYTKNGRNRNSDPSVVRLLEKAGASQNQDNKTVVSKSEQLAQSVFLTQQGDSAGNTAMGKTGSPVDSLKQNVGRVSGGAKDSKLVNSSSSNSASGGGGSKVVRSQSLNTSARKPVLQQDTQPNSMPSGSAASANLKRSQSIGNVKTETVTQQTCVKPVVGSAQTQKRRGAPHFLVRVEWSIVRDSFQEFANVLMKSVTDVASSSAQEPATKKLPSASHDKPESAYIKENTQVAGSVTGERSRHNSESRRSVSDVAFSGVDAAVENSTGANDSKVKSSTQPSQKPNSSVQNRSQAQAATSLSSANSGAKNSAPKNVIASKTSSQSCDVSKGGSVQSKPSNSNSSSSVTTSAKMSNVQAKTVQKPQQAESVNVKVSPSSAANKIGENSAKQNSVNSGKSAITNTQVVPNSATRPAVSKATPSSSASSTTGAGLSQSLRSSSSENPGSIRKSASTDSLTSLKLGGSASGKKLSSTEAGKRPAAAGSNQKNLSTSAKDVTARLAGTGGTPRAGSNSGQQTSRSSNSSASSAAGKNSGNAKDGAKSGISVSKNQVSQPVSSVSVSATNTSAAVSSASSVMPKPAASITSTKVTAATVLAKAIQNFPPKAAASPRPGVPKGKQNTSTSSSTPVSKATVSITSKSTSSVTAAQNSTSLKAAAVSASVSSTGSGVKEGVTPSNSAAKPAVNTSKSVPASVSSQPGPAPAQNAFVTTKAGSSPAVSGQKSVAETKPIPTAASSTPPSPVSTFAKAPHIVKSPSDSVLARKPGSGNSGKDSEAESEAGIEPLVKITFGNVSPRAQAALPRKYEPPICTPVIVNPFEHLSVYQTPRDKSPGQGVSASDFGYTVGKPTKDTAATQTRERLQLKANRQKQPRKERTARDQRQGHPAKLRQGRGGGPRAKNPKAARVKSHAQRVAKLAGTISEEAWKEGNRCSG
ncbi:hypothetical protein BaRGS_00028349 [Batillaria attramentaria]|uniref:Ankyrin n=1 Tax=Batillaria attramentaria TaxID=370345 RepID=A0ABD0K0R5_9CAEN